MTNIQRSQEVVEFFPALVDGKPFHGSASQIADAVNPANGKCFGQFPMLNASDAAKAVESSHHAFQSWRRTHPSERAEMVLRFADAVEADRERLTQLDVWDNGSPIAEMRKDVDVGLMYLRYFAGIALGARGETIPTGHDRLNYTAREPYGVVVRIVPFNHPLMFALRVLAPPLLTGNTVIIKPSEDTSIATLALMKHVQAIFPPGVVSIVTGTGAEAGDALVRHDKVYRIAFIGHDKTGRRIQRSAAETGVKTVTLELGGKNPIVVCPDADFEAAVEGAVSGMRFNFQSQACGSTSRLYVHRSMYDAFVERLADRLDRIRIGNPDLEETETGAIVTRSQYQKILNYIEIGVSEGGSVIAGGGRPDDPDLIEGMFVRPTLFSGLSHSSRLVREEIFGPVLTALPFDSFQEAVNMANDTSYGLTAALYTRDLSFAHRFARDVEAGYVWVNDNQRHFLGTPYGGTKSSGIGKEEDPTELLSYTKVKNVNLRFESEWL